MTPKQATDEQQRLQFFIGIVLGSALAVTIYNLVLGLILRHQTQVILSLIFFGFFGVAALVSGSVERVYPSIAHNVGLFVLLLYLSVAIGFIGVHKLRSILDHWNLNSNRNKIAIFAWLDHKQSYPSVIALGTVIPILGYHSLYLFSLPIIFTISAFYGHMNTRLNEPSERRQLLETAFLSTVMALAVSVLSAYEIIEPGVIRTLLFEIVGIVAGIPFVIISTLDTKEVERSQRRFIKDIKNQGTTISGAKQGDPIEELDGKVQDRGDALTYAPEEHQIVTMFVDIAAFSKITAPLPSDIVFQELSLRLTAITDIIKEFGGSIDRSLGDGLLCFFGYRSQHSAAFNTQRAFLAARKIQESSVSQVLSGKNVTHQSMIMPVRIGIHSSALVLGNLGGGTRIDFNMIGAGVNFASRLETACTPFKIMFSDTCYHHLVELGYHPDDFAQVAIHIKHRVDLVHAYEYDPFKQRRPELRQAETAYFDQLGIKLSDQRYAIRQRGTVILRRGEVEFAVCDLSRFGFRALARTQFGPQSRLVVDVVLADPEQMVHLQEKFVDRLTVEVRWSQHSTTDDGQYEHGFRIVGSSAEQRQYLFDLIAKHYAVVGPEDLDELVQEVA
ncbi:MAG: hypothetical protein FJ146_14760 [Deltaproteobacteria bacterium]|nr:hypothetical protein [Deltaproteobacteria bacterium]